MSAFGVSTLIAFLLAGILLIIGLCADLGGTRLGGWYARVLPFLWVVLLTQPVIRLVNGDIFVAIVCLPMVFHAFILWQQYRHAGDLADEVGT